MRFVLPFILLAALVVPTASAMAPSGLAIDAPAQVDANAPITLTIALNMSDFACAADQTFNVDVSATAAASAVPILNGTSVTFVVPAGSYLFETWQGNATLNMTITGDATTSDDVTVHALFAPADEGSCVTAGEGGFRPSEATVTIHVGPPTSTTPPPETTPPTSETTPPAPTTDANSTTTNQTTPTGPTPAANGTTNSTGGVDELPPGGGYIGDYNPTESSKSTPGVALVGTLVAAALVAIAVRRRRG